MKISWTTPASNFDAITSYKVLIKTSADTFVEDTTNCNGSTQGILDSSSCVVPISVLRATPYNLALGDYIKATVQASNIRGAGPVSLETTDVNAVKVKTEPAHDSTIIRDSSTSESSISRTWNAPSQVISQFSTTICNWTRAHLHGLT